jgi:hypothetical protein
VTTEREQPRRSASSHHNLVRFALKCLPPAAAAKIVLGELLRLPRHPQAVSSGLLAAAREVRTITRLRSALRVDGALLQRALEDRL